jgi:archaellum biogenesis protein FlaJ (TadC family)
MWHEGCISYENEVAMKRWIVLTILVVASVHTALAYISGIAIQTDKNSTFQVYINGKLRTAQPNPLFG